MSEGRILKALSGFYYVDTGSEVLQCRARGKFRKEGVSPLVGDRVEVRELGGGEGFVEKILPRHNAFARPAVANIDQLVIIASAAVPKTDPFLIDRVVSIAALKDCDVIRRTSCLPFTRKPASRPFVSALRPGRVWSS